MTYLLILAAIAVFVFLIYQWFSYRKVAVANPNYGRQKAVFYLYTGFFLLLSISNIFAEAIFTFLEVEKPAQFEILTLIAYLGMCATIAVIFKAQNKTAIQRNEKGSSHNIQNNHF